MSKSTKGNRGKGDKRKLRSTEETDEEKLSKALRLYDGGKGLSLSEAAREAGTTRGKMRG
jgi:hypothetical protein